MSTPEQQPGRFGAYGGRYVPETLIPALDELDARLGARRAPTRPIGAEVAADLRDYAGRPTPLTFARRLTEALGGAAGLAQARGPAPHRRAQDQQHRRPGAAGAADGQEAGHRRDRRGPARRGHGHRPARCSGLACEVYMGARGRAAPGAQRLAHEAARRHGARRWRAGTRTLKDAMNEAIRDWVTQRARTPTTSSAARPGRTPIPTHGAGPAADHRRRGARAVRRSASARLPDAVVACVGGGSNAIGALHRLPRGPGGRVWWRWRRAATGSPAGKHGASLDARAGGRAARDALSSVLQTDDGQIAEAHSITAGLDYPGVGPELAYLRDTGRLDVRTATDDEALRPSRGWRASRASSRRWRRRTRSPGRGTWRASWARASGCW